MAINKVMFNSVDFWEDLGAALASPVSYPIPAEIKEQVKVKGANGSLTEATGYFNDLTLKLKFKAILPRAEAPSRAFDAYKRRINKLFYNITSPRLAFSEVHGKYYKVKSCEVGAITRISDYEATFEIDFICDAFLYDANEQPVTSAGDVNYNGDIPNAPTITFTAGSSSQYTVTTNGKALTFTGSQNKKVEINANPYSIVIVDGVPVESAGSAPILTPGANTISISGGGYNSLNILKKERYLG